VDVTISASERLFGSQKANGASRERYGFASVNMEDATPKKSAAVKAPATIGSHACT
jgi:hypothetical protein